MAVNSLLAQHMLGLDGSVSSPRSGLSSMTVPTDFDACRETAGGAGVVSLLVVRNPYERMLSFFIEKVLRPRSYRRSSRRPRFRQWLLSVTSRPPSRLAGALPHTASDATRCDSLCEARKHYAPISTTWPLSCVSARVLRLEVRACPAPSPHAPTYSRTLPC
tara:strand:+ start:493 stop:978 length:486 start_codon:yes stop_codon:yes gene_type:complete